MATIDTYLSDIMSAVRGEEVRQSIHDAIEAINDEESHLTQERVDEAVNVAFEDVRINNSCDLVKAYGTLQDVTRSGVTFAWDAAKEVCALTGQRTAAAFNNVFSLSNGMSGCFVAGETYHFIIASSNISKVFIRLFFRLPDNSDIQLDLHQTSGTFTIPDDTIGVTVRIQCDIATTVSSISETISFRILNALSNLDLERKIIDLSKNEYVNSTMANIVKTAESYFKMAYVDHNLVYAANRSLFHPMYQEDNKNAIQCSGFINAITKGIDAYNSVYTGRRNTSASWAIDGSGEYQVFDNSSWIAHGGISDTFCNTYDYMSANDLYLYCLSRGEVIDVDQAHPENNRFYPGDLLFSEYDDETERYGHVSMVLNSGKFFAGNGECVNDIRLMEAYKDVVDYSGNTSVGVRTIRRNTSSGEIQNYAIKIGRMQYPPSMCTIEKLHEADLNDVSGVSSIYNNDETIYNPGFYTIVLNGYNGSVANPYITVFYEGGHKSYYLIKSANRAVCTFFAESNFTWSVSQVNNDTKDYEYTDVKLYKGYYC